MTKRAVDGWVVGVDLGGSKLAALLIDGEGRVRHRIWREHRACGYAAVLAEIIGAVAGCQEVAGLAGEVVAGVGVAVAGPLSPDRERVLIALNLGLAGEPLRRDLRRRLGIPVRLENDANAAAVAEHRRGAGTAARCLVLLTLGTGIGGGIVTDGRVLAGGHGAAAELGHIPVVRPGRRCGCGARGCLERYASGPALAERAARLLAAGPGPALAGRPVPAGAVSAPPYPGRGADPVLTARHVTDAAAAGDPVAAGLLTEAGQRIGRALATVAPVVDPDLVLLAGGLAESGAAHLLPAVRSALASSRPFQAQSGPVRVELAACGAEAGALGAAELARAR